MILLKCRKIYVLVFSRSGVKTFTNTYPFLPSNHVTLPITLSLLIFGYYNSLLSFVFIYFMIIQLILLILISLCIKFSYDLHKSNNSAILIQLQNPNHATINDVLHEKSPLIVHNLAAKYFDLFEE